MPGRPRRPTSKKGATTGSGGQGRRRLAGRGPTPPAEQRTGHPARRRAHRGATDPATGKPTSAKPGSAKPGSAKPARQAGQRPSRPAGGGSRAGRPGVREAAELVVGRNPVVEALRAKVPATALYIALGIDLDERVRTAVRLAGDRRVDILEVGRHELDRLSSGAVHQGIGLQVPPYAYRDADDLLTAAEAVGEPALLVALDGVTDPRNLGAVVRSAAAFGAHGTVVPQRRSAGMTATAWRSSAGAAARLPVARVTNLVRTLGGWQRKGLTVVGLEASGTVELDDFELANDPIVLVVGSEGRGLSRLVAQTCDLTVAIPMASTTESLNASVAAAVMLAEVARRRRRPAG